MQNPVWTDVFGGRHLVVGTLDYDPAQLSDDEDIARHKQQEFARKLNEVLNEYRLTYWDDGRITEAL